MAIAGGVIAIVWVVVISLLVGGQDFLMLAIALVGVGSLIILAGAIVVFAPSQGQRPEAIYTKGFLARDGVGGSVFIPWGALVRAEERDVESFNDGEVRAGGRVLVLYAKGTNVFEVSSDIVSYGRIRSLALEGAGSGPSGSPEFDRTLRGSFVKWAVITMGLAALCGLLFGALLTFMLPTFLGVGSNGVAVLGPVLALLTYPPMLVFVARSQSGVPRGPMPQAVGLALLLALLLLLVGLSDAVDLSGSALRTEAIGSSDYPPTSLAPGEYDGLRRTLDGPIEVKSGETLTLRDCALTFDLTYYTSGILVNEGGTLVMERTWLKPLDPDQPYSVEVAGELRMKECILERMYQFEAFDGHRYLSGGLELRTDDAVVEGTTFRESQGWGILAYECSPTIVACNFSDIGGAGVLIVRGSPSVRNCTFSGVGEGIAMELSAPSILGCTFRGCDRALSVLVSDPTVRNCTFEQGVASVIVTDLYSNVDESGNQDASSGAFLIVSDDWSNRELPWIMRHPRALEWAGAALAAFGAVLIPWQLARCQRKRVAG